MTHRDEVKVNADKARDEGVTCRQAGIAWMREQNSRLLEHLPGALEGNDPEELHDLRVASRRLRAAMLLFEPVFAPRDFRKWYRRVSAITKALGAARDADVQLEAIRRRQSSMSAPEKADVDVWLLVHYDRRATARIQMANALTDWRDRGMSGRFSRVLKRLDAVNRTSRRAARLAETIPAALEARDG